MRRVAIAFVLCLTGSLSASTLRVLMVGDTNDRSIGKSVVTDLANFEQFVRDASSKAGMTLDLTTIKGNQVKSRVITDAVNNLKADADDTVIFYYSGHGFRTQQVKTRWPLLYIPDAGTKGVDFQWVIDTLNKKNPRMILAISDSCNSFIDGGRAINLKAMKPEQEAQWRKLFAEYKGRIYASGSQIGQYSFGSDDTGGAFSSRFLGIVRGETTGTNANWDNIMKQATKPIPINNPQQRSQDPQYEIVNAGGQTPQFSLVPGPAPTPATAPVTPAATPDTTDNSTDATTDSTDPGSDNSEMCNSLNEFQTALTTVKDSMPAKFDFKKQQSDLASYQQMVTALVQAGGDKDMVNLARTMDQGLKAKNWSKFRSAVWAYQGHIAKLQQQACGSN